MADNFEYILNNGNKGAKYYSALMDIHLFTLAILANISFVKRELSIPVNTSFYEKVEDYAYRLFKSQVVSNEQGGWVLQPGVWSDHPDYAYAGIVTSLLPEEKNFVDDIVQDVSHFHRYPLWLKSLMKMTTNEKHKRYYISLLEGLAVQLNIFCVIKPDA